MSDETTRTTNPQSEAGAVERAVSVNGVPDGYVLVYDSPDYETGEVVCATLASQGIHAVMKNPMLGPATNLLPPLGNTWSHAVFVAAADEETARMLLAQESPTEEDLAAEQAADPMTLEEAEQSVRDA